MAPPAARARKGKRQRFYARNAADTTLDRAFGRLMQSFPGRCANSYDPTRIYPVLNGLADECCGMLAHLVLYVGALALLAIVGIHLWDELPAGAALKPPARADWRVALRSHPAFAISEFDLPEKTEAYEILRHPDGLHELETAGIIDSKFGAVTLLRVLGGTDRARSCLGFIKRVDDPNLRISGWSCQGDTLPARRAAISCMLNGLALLSTGNDPKLAELFARAELRRGDCAISGTPALSADWLTGTDNPRLRGAF